MPQSVKGDRPDGKGKKDDPIAMALSMVTANMQPQLHVMQQQAQHMQQMQQQMQAMQGGGMQVQWFSLYPFVLKHSLHVTQAGLPDATPPVTAPVEGVTVL
jgi:hypothetical protein